MTVALANLRVAGSAACHLRRIGGSCDGLPSDA